MPQFPLPPHAHSLRPGARFVPPPRPCALPSSSFRIQCGFPPCRPCTLPHRPSPGQQTYRPARQPARPHIAAASTPATRLPGMPHPRSPSTCLFQHPFSAPHQDTSHPYPPQFLGVCQSPGPPSASAPPVGLKPPLPLLTFSLIVSCPPPPSARYSVKSTLFHLCGAPTHPCRACPLLPTITPPSQFSFRPPTTPHIAALPGPATHPRSCTLPPRIAAAPWF